MRRYQSRRPSRIAVALNYALSIIFIVAGIGVLILIAPVLYTRYAGASTPATAVPAIATVRPVEPLSAPIPIAIPNPPIVVQQAPAGEAPQVVQFQPVAPPAENAPEPQARPMIIVQHVDDSGHQVITGSGACAVARGARPVWKMSNVRSEPLTRTPFGWSKIAAVCAWFGGVFTTYLFFNHAMPELWFGYSAITATLVQWTLTLAERPLWRFLLKRSGGRMAVLGIVITLIDAMLNAAGVYPFTSRLAQTDLGRMLAEVFGVQAAMSAQPSFMVAFLIGLLVASLPEALWES